MEKNQNLQAKNPMQTLRRLLSYLGEYKSTLVFVVIFLIISSLTQVIGISALGYMIDNIITPLLGQPNPSFQKLIRFIVVMIGVYISGAVSDYIYSRMMVNVSTSILHTIRTDLFEHMQQLPVRFFDQTPHGEIMSRYTNDTDTLREFYSNALTNILSSTVTFVGVFIAMVVISPLLTLLVLVMLAIMLLIVRWLGKKSSYYHLKHQESIGVANGFLEEMIEGQAVVKVFNHEKQVTQDFEGLNEDVRLTALGSITYANLLMPILMNLSYGHFALTAMAGALLSISGGIGLGQLASFLQFTRNFSQPISQISQQFNTVLRALAGAERIFMILDMDPEKDDGYITLVNALVDEKGKVTESDVRTGRWAWKEQKESGVEYTPLQGHIVFDKVSFGYDPSHQVLKNIEIDAQPGQKIALVGSTGAGKTTITNLLNRFYDINQGTIFYDGIDITQIKKDDLRRSLAMVLQDTNLFTGSVAYNIRYGRLDASKEDILAAAKLANADSFVDTLPQRYDTELAGDGGNLSEGQRQLLSISRAAVADPPALILDEATSSIDTRTEAMISTGMEQLMENRTSFVIAHRLSTIMDSDVILVMENGEIIERGNHQTLVAQKGRYYQLYTGALELS